MIKLLTISLFILLLVFFLLLFAVIYRRKKYGKTDNSGETKPVSGPVNCQMPERSTIAIGNAQHIGTRAEQQDSFGITNADPAIVAVNGLFAVVADGMGGMNNLANADVAFRIL